MINEMSHEVLLMVKHLEPGLPQIKSIAEGEGTFI